MYLRLERDYTTKPIHQLGKGAMEAPRTRRSYMGVRGCYAKGIPIFVQFVNTEDGVIPRGEGM